ncbi:hypothetical protein H0H81_008887, partial [Sphagnurus paluster]
TTFIPRALIPDFQIINTSHHLDRNSDKKIKPDPTMYRDTLSFEANNGPTDFSEMELNFELKYNDSYDPFQDPGPKDDIANFQFEATAKHRADCRGQLVRYATEWFKRQHRHFGFTIFICGTFARFIRWDRAGAIVSARFDYRTDSRPLIAFLWRFSNSDRA